jgi:hypothetical protein
MEISEQTFLPEQINKKDNQAPIEDYQDKSLHSSHLLSGIGQGCHGKTALDAAGKTTGAMSFPQPRL